MWEVGARMRTSKRRERAGISTAVITLIILVIGVALAVVAMAIAGGFITGWGGAARVTIERADILVDPSTGKAYITVDVRNSGGAALSACSVTIPDVSASFSPASTELRPGQALSFTTTADDISAGKSYVIQVSCEDPAGNTVSDQKSALAHI